MVDLIKDVIKLWDEPKGQTTDAGPQYPPSDWLQRLWDYLRRQHPTDLSPFLGLPLLPLGDGKVVPLTLPSMVIMRSEFGVTLSPGLSRCLELVGVTVVDGLAEHVRCHAAVVGSFVRLPLHEDVVDAIFAARRKVDVATVFRDETTEEEKLELLALIGNVSRQSIDVEQLNFLRTLPIFKSTRSTADRPQFVSAADVKKAHASHGIVTLEEAFIDVSSSEARTAATTLQVAILKEGSFIKDHVLSEIKNRRLKPEDVQKCMRYVFDNIQVLQRDDPQLLQRLVDISFVTTKAGHVVSPTSVYDPTDTTLRALFVGEDNHFPGEFYDSPENLIILRKIGMKTASNVSARDILYTAAQVETMCSTMADDTRQKAEALLTFLTSHTDLLWEEVNGGRLVDWLKDIAWVPVYAVKPEQFPVDLTVDAEDVVHKASDVKSYDWVSIVGRVVPIVRCRANESISQLFGWDTAPSLDDVVRQFKLVVASYSYDAVADYTVIVRKTYNFLSEQSVDDVQEALEAAGLRDWVWHGEGFTAEERALLQPPPLPLKPYVYTLPRALQQFHSLLSACGVARHCSGDVLVNVLHDMKAKYDNSGGDRVTGGTDSANDATQSSAGSGDPVRRTDNHRHSVDEIESDHRLAIDILNHMKSLVLSDSVLERVLVPTGVDGTACLLPASECTYCDVEWLRKGFDSMEFDESDGIILVHHHLPTSTAAALGVPTLMSRMLHAEELEITSFGQGEPLTSTLRRMLEDYTDGLAIPKELVQNADDAGATEVRFLYDERTHNDARKYLFDEGMRECQGPALWCYSNSTFTDSDLDNIIRLGGAAKQSDPTKIGRFGLGFNVVYNLTDVPSFVTDNIIVFFDPHTTHLGHSIHDKSKPGIKIDLRRNRTLLRKLSHQFQPYKGVFGCDMDAVSGPSWPGTLFRFPLRTKLQAQRSDISGLHYDTAHVSQLLTLLADNAHSLLLFTQNVKKVSLWHLSSDASPENAVNIFSVSSDTVMTIRDFYPHDTKSDRTRSDTFLKAAIRYRDHGSDVAAMEPPQTSTIIKVESSLSDKSDLLQTRPTASVKFWLSCLCVAEGRALRLAQEMTNEGYVPAAAVAVRLLSVEKGYVPATPGEDDRDAGQVFNFLPLPVRSGLPVHINGMFAVHSNRRCLVERTADDTGSNQHAWNDALLKDGVVAAYAQMLHELQPLVAAATQDVSFYSLWPTVVHTEPYFQPVVREFYRFLAAHGNTAPVIYNADNSSVVTLNRVAFLHPELVASPQLQQLVSSVFRQCVTDTTPVSVGGAILDSFREAGCGSFVAANTYDLGRFFADIFFPNIQRLSADERDPLVRFALESKKVDSLLTEYPCVPTTPDGETLRTPQDLVHPRGAVAKLYQPEDARFPHGGSFTDKACLRRLSELGMACNEITWDNLIERLESVQSIYQNDTAAGNCRIQCTLDFIARKLTQQNESSPKTEEYEKLQLMAEAAQERIVQIPFVPLLPKPRNFPLAWKNDEYGKVVLAPSDLYPLKLHQLVSAVHPIGNSQTMTAEVRKFLGLIDKPLSLDVVMAQFEHMLALTPTELEDAAYDSFQSACFSMYSLLQTRCQASDIASLVKSALNERSCILVQHQFQPAHKVTFSSRPGCEPYMYSLPSETARRYRPLMELLGVRENFTSVDYVDAMHELKQCEGDAELTGPRLLLAITLATRLGACMDREKCKPEDLKQKDREIYIPNERGVLHSIGALYFNDFPAARSCAEAGDSATQNDAVGVASNNTHKMLSYGVAMHLGVRTKKQETLSKHAQGIPFGQKEDLTTSLRRILASYPFNNEILKELIQNADDAGATEIHFVNDSRHHSEEAIFGPSWKPLQGPALCVYNNRPFTEEDLKGIQRLGEGSKTHDSSKTGQYGIGFSSAYHLTDVPSVLTRPPGTNKSLCVFDPHSRFVPGSTRLEPGMRYDVAELVELFPDVFSCYLPQCFDVDNATLFRFPLRTSEMAQTSDISQQAVSVNKLRMLLDQTRREARSMLLFTNHVKKISISEVDHDTGELTNTYTAIAGLSDVHLKQKDELADSTRAAARADDDDDRLRDVPLREVVTTLVINDTNGATEKWCVSEQLGTEQEVVVPDSVIHAVRAGELRLLPRGGVACRLECDVVEEAQKPNGVFCFLPLPIVTTLPVHVNGHFALGYENRRTLWDKADRDSYKTEWNEFLCREVIAPCYVRLLTAVRAEVFHAAVDENNCTVVDCSRRQLDDWIAVLQSLFPSFDDAHPEWDSLVKAVYDSCARTNAPLFPAVRQRVNPDSTTAEWQVTWLPLTGEGAQKAFFTKCEEAPEDKPESAPSILVKSIGMVKSLGMSMFSRKAPPKAPEKTDSEVLRDTLRECGLKVLEASPALTANLQRAEIPVEFLSPESVMAFFVSHSSDSPSCQLGGLPVPLSESVFGDTKTLLVVLRYCCQDPQFVARLDGTPLLLTADDMLRVFDSDSPVYHSDSEDLAVTCKHLFMHRELVHGVFSDVSPTDTPVLSEFTVNDLVRLLDAELPADRLCRTECHVEWSARDTALPGEDWLRQLWHFLDSQTEIALYQQQGQQQHQRGDGSGDNSDDDGGEENDKGAMADTVATYLRPLNDWCLIPARAATKRYLVPIGMASTVIHFHELPSPSWRLRDVLRKLHLPELDLLERVVGGGATSGATSSLLRPARTTTSVKPDVLRALVTSVDKPRMVLSVVHALVAHRSAALDGDERRCLLTYFNDHVEALLREDRTDSVERLKDLPLYTTVCGDVIQLAGNVTYTLPAGVPTSGMDVWRNRSGIVFLRQDAALELLHAAIDCAPVTLSDVYCDFIFQHLEYLSGDDRMTHLHYVYTTYMEAPTDDLADDDRDKVVSALRQLAIIDAGADGEMRPVSEFYDPDNHVFRSMLPAESFPPTEPPGEFTRRQWRGFLNKLGLQHEFTPEMYMQFVGKVARESATGAGDDVTQRRSSQLVQHLFDMTDAESQKQIMQSVADVAFVPEARVDPSLQRLHPQRAADGRYISFRDSVSTKHAAIAWTQAKLLPDWADPDRTIREPKRAAEVKKCLGIADSPPVQTVAMHLRELCETPTRGDNAVKQKVFTTVYSHLQTHGLEDPDVIRSVLANTPCVLVDDGSVVFANQTVVDMYDTDEIRPYLYRVPPRLVEFGQLLEILGATKRATADQYGRVLNPLYAQTRGSRLNPNEMRLALKAMAGLLRVLKEGERPPDVPLLHLLGEAGKLVQSTRLVFNDAPAYYDRAGELPGLQFLARVPGWRDSSLEESLHRLPTDLQPKMLSSIVRERLLEECTSLDIPSGPAGRLNARLRSPVFLTAIDRLARHEAHRRGIEPDSERIADATNRLSTINVRGVVGDVVTELVYRNKPVDGSQMKKTCFVEKPLQSGHVSQWRIYVSSDAELSLDLLVSVTDVINDIMSGLLRHAVLYLLPILRCQSDDEIDIKLNSLNVREGHAASSTEHRRFRVMPQPGDTVAESDRDTLRDGQWVFAVGEYVGYRKDDTGPFLHGVIKQQLMPTSDASTYLLDLGGSSAVIANSTHLYKYTRN